MSSHVHQWFEEYKQIVNKALYDQSKPWTKGFAELEHRSGIDRLHIFCGGAFFCALYLVFGFGAQLLCNIIGVVYPAYASLHDIQKSSKEEDTNWITYWVTFGIFTVIEFFSYTLVHIIPFYWLLKCVFLIWCMMPTEKNGSYVVYNKLVRPYFLKQRD